MAGTGATGPTGTERLWARIRRPYNVVEALDAVLGLSPNVARQLAGAMLATSDEAEDLLEAMPRTIRSLTISISSKLEECRGELRGPVMWSETMSRRSASAGSQDLYLCTAPHRAYDVLENQVLVTALGAIGDAGHSVESMSARAYDDETMRRARENGRRALRYLDHRTLSGVTREKPAPRELKRARSGTRRRTYEFAFTMLDRAGEPLRATDILPFCDRRTRIQHELVMALADGLEARGAELPSFRPIEGSLEAGPLHYVHPRRRGDRTRPHGVQLGDLLLDVPERLRDRHRGRNQQALAARAGELRAHLVLEQADVDAALDSYWTRRVRRGADPVGARPRT